MAKLKNWDINFQNKLLNSLNYREFLSYFFTKDRTWNEPKRISYGEFTERSGMSSRAFLSDVIQQRKRITVRAFDSVCKGLKLTKPWKDFLWCMVLEEEKNFGKKPFDISKIHKKKIICKKKNYKNKCDF